MSVSLTIDMPESVFSAIRKSPSEFAAEMRLAAAVKWCTKWELYHRKRLRKSLASPGRTLSSCWPALVSPRFSPRPTK